MHPPRTTKHPNHAQRHSPIQPQTGPAGECRREASSTQPPRNGEETSRNPARSRPTTNPTHTAAGQHRRGPHKGGKQPPQPSTRRPRTAAAQGDPGQNLPRAPGEGGSPRRPEARGARADPRPTAASPQAPGRNPPPNRPREGRTPAQPEAAARSPTRTPVPIQAPPSTPSHQTTQGRARQAGTRGHTPGPHDPAAQGTPGTPGTRDPPPTEPDPMGVRSVAERSPNRQSAGVMGIGISNANDRFSHTPRQKLFTGAQDHIECK
ncbi:synapsin-1-like [Nerophis ophidion]|uniref:synapsin-1-like n=1 Tax=Nerophis ophidion TaxID=159077 RepID=UPI002AE0068F|nr:synapsin-1-like [Nerophis ophidion]